MFVGRSHDKTQLSADFLHVSFKNERSLLTLVRKLLDTTFR